jgi:chromosome segregation ATPase
MQAMLDEAESNVQTWQEKHRDVIAEMRMVADKARQHEVLSEDYKHDLDSTWAQLEEEKRMNGTLTEQVQKLKRQLATCSADVEQLKSLALAGSRSQSDLESKIMSQAAEVRDAQSTIQSLNDCIHQRTEMHEKTIHELADAQAVIQKLDAERDRLQVPFVCRACLFINRICNGTR